MKPTAFIVSAASLIGLTLSIADSAPIARTGRSIPPALLAAPAKSSATCLTRSCIYVANTGRFESNKPGTSVQIFSADANKKAAPVADITGLSTGLDSPIGIAVDDAHNVYVSNTFWKTGFAINVFGPSDYGNAPPIRSISGSNTQLLWPHWIALDGNDDIYVANGWDTGVNQILVFGAGANGNVAPTQIIAGANTGLSSPEAVALDKAGKIYVMNFYYDGGSVTVYSPNSNGNAMPISTITGSATGFMFLNGMAVDASGEIYVVNQGYFSIPSSIFVFAAGANGNVAPIRTISGPNTQMGSLAGIAVDTTGRIYVTEVEKPGVVLIYAAGANGNVAPIRTIGGSRSRLKYPWGITVH